MSASFNRRIFDNRKENGSVVERSAPCAGAGCKKPTPAAGSFKGGWGGGQFKRKITFFEANVVFTLQPRYFL